MSDEDYEFDLSKFMDDDKFQALFQEARELIITHDIRGMLRSIEHDLNPDCHCATCNTVKIIKMRYQ